MVTRSSETLAAPVSVETQPGSALDAGWHHVGAVAVLFIERPCHGVQIAGERIGLFKVDDAVFAIDEVCTHGVSNLTDGFLEGFEIECPLHAGVFDLRDGRVISGPALKSARCHATRIEAGELYVKLLVTS